VVVELEQRQVRLAAVAVRVVAVVVYVPAGIVEQKVLEGAEQLVLLALVVGVLSA
jgi:threonine/homoserine efflux transporter RhtA